MKINTDTAHCFWILHTSNLKKSCKYPSALKLIWHVHPFPFNKSSHSSSLSLRELGTMPAVGFGFQFSGPTEVKNCYRDTHF
jgi:hypothetical protein